MALSDRRAVVVGAGAVGSFVGACLALGGWDVTLLRRSGGDEVPVRLEVVEPGGGRRAANVTQVGWEHVGPVAPDLLVFAVKMFDLRDALASAARWPVATTLTVENGIGAEELAAELRPTAALVAGSLTTSVERRGAEVRRLTRGGLGLAVASAGASGDAVAFVGRLAGSLAASGLRARSYPDARAMKWSKLVANLVANATSALLDWEPGRVYADPRTFAIDRQQLVEALRVMRALRLRPVGLPGTPVPLLAGAARLPPWLARPLLRRVVGGARGGKPPSLQGHLQAGGGPSEAAWLNGAVVRAGSGCGVDAPVNRALTRLMEEASADPERRRWLRGHPERLEAEVRTEAAPGRRGR